jgi:hypothetical protein
MKPILILLTSTLFLQNISFAGSTCRWGALLSNNVVTLPITGYPATLYSAFNPGIDFLVEHQINKHDKNQFWMSYQGGVYYHRFFQTGIRIYPEISYRRAFSKRTSVNIGLLAGYLHSVTDYDKFELTNDGTYKKIPGWYGRAQFIFGLGLGVSYGVLKKDPDKLRLQLQFKSFFQGPFAGSYVLILPTNSLMLGFTMPISKTENK